MTPEPRVWFSFNVWEFGWRNKTRGESNHTPWCCWKGTRMSTLAGCVWFPSCTRMGMFSMCTLGAYLHGVVPRSSGMLLVAPQERSRFLASGYTSCRAAYEHQVAYLGADVGRIRDDHHESPHPFGCSGLDRANRRSRIRVDVCIVIGMFATFALYVFSCAQRAVCYADCCKVRNALPCEIEHCRYVLT